VWGRLSHYGLRSCGVDLCGILAIYLDQALVVGLLSSESMGIYAVALSLSRVIGSVHASVAMMVFPKVVGLAPREMAVAVGRSARMGTIAAGGVGLLILAAGPTLLLWLYGPSYGASNHILPVLVLEAIVAGLAQVLLQGFLAAGRPGIATSVLAGGLVFSVPLFLLLVPAFGVLGASIALVAASSMRVVLTMVAYRSVLRQPVPRVWIGGADLAELGHYRGALVRSVLRFRATGESK
jgi:O-antigen/teichoic acid export membrane protein